MVAFATQLPTDAGTTGDLARQFGQLVGPAVAAPDGSVAAQEYLAAGGALALARTATLHALAQAFPASADDCLGDWEAELGLPVASGLASATRVASILARVRAVGGTPQRIVASAETLAGGTVTIVQVLYSAVTTPRYVFRFGVLVSAALAADGIFRAALDDLLQRLAPSQCTWVVGTTSPFRCDDPLSLCDRDLLGS